jgi:PAS domain S-box-containing protein
MPKSGLELIRHTRWYIRLRWLLLLAIIAPALVSLYLGSGLTHERLSSLVIAAVAVGSNVLFYGLSHLRRRETYYRALALSMLAFDVLFISYFIYSKGGIESRSMLLYALPILMSAPLFGRASVYIAASGSALGYDAVILANYLGIIHSPDAVTHQATNLTYVLNSIIFFTVLLLLVGTISDLITRLLLQKQEEALIAAAALRRAQAIARVGSWEWDVANNTIRWSDELYDIFGLGPESSHSTYEDYLRHIHPDDRSWVAGIIERSLKTHKPFSYDHRIVKRGNKVQIIHTEGKVVTNRRGKAVQLYGTAQDITDERMLEAAKGDFVSLASHQLRTPASGVRMLLGMLQEGYVGKLTLQQRRTVQDAFDANERLLKIADDLLNVAKLESGRLVLNRQEIDLAAWLQTMWPQQKLLARERHLKLKLELPDKPVRLYGDPERLAMVVDNLLSNARKYTPPRGTVTVTLKPGTAAHTITVADTGSGMTRAEIARLFGKFTRLDNLASEGTDGTGLGLYLAKSIVDLHHGSIKVSSKPGAGSIFTVRLPKNPL